MNINLKLTKLALNLHRKKIHFRFCLQYLLLWCMGLKKNSISTGYSPKKRILLLVTELLLRLGLGKNSIGTSLNKKKNLIFSYNRLWCMRLIIKFKLGLVPHWKLKIKFCFWQNYCYEAYAFENMNLQPTPSELLFNYFFRYCSMMHENRWSS